jgi:hypothetical protein
VASVYLARDTSACRKPPLPSLPAVTTNLAASSKQLRGVVLTVPTLAGCAAGGGMDRQERV